MRYFFRGRVPKTGRVLLIESGSRHILEKAYPRVAALFPGATFALCTCFPGEPAPGGFESVYRVSEREGAFAKLRLLAHLVVHAAPPVAAVISSTESVMSTWRAALFVLLPSKILVINEHADFFWFDWSNRKMIAKFLAARAGVDGFSALRTTCRVLAFPFVFLAL